MSKFDENLFSRIALFNNYVTKEQLGECLNEQRAGESGLPLGDLLLQRGYLTQEQLDTILSVRRKKIRKYLRSAKEARAGDKGFGQVAIAAGFITPDALEDALLEQERLQRVNLRFRLGEILVSKKLMTVQQVLEVLSEQGKRILVCPVCDCHFNVADFEAERTYQCTKCESQLSEPNYLDTVAVDAII